VPHYEAVPPRYILSEATFTLLKAGLQMIGLRRSRSWILVIPLLLLATWLGSRSLNRYTLWVDEIIAMNTSGAVPYGPISPAEIVNRVTLSCCWPPGHNFLLAGWNNLVGSSPFAGRALSLLIGVVAVAWVYRLGHDIKSPTVGLGSAAVMATSVFFVYYMYELRGYTLYAMFTVMCLVIYWRIVNRGITWLSGVLLILSLDGLAYTHYAALLTAISVGVYHLLVVRKTRQWWYITGLMAIAFTLYIPWLVSMFILPQSTVSPGQKLTFREIFTVIVTGVSNHAPLLLAGLAGIAVIKARGKGVLYIFFWAASVLILSVLFYLTPNFLQSSRHIMFAVPILALLVGLGVDVLARYRIRPGLILSVWIVIGIAYNLDAEAYIQSIPGIQHRLPASEFIPALKMIQSCAQPTDSVIVHLDYSTWDWLYGIALNYYMTVYHLPVKTTILYPNQTPSSETDRAENSRFIANAPHVWTLIDRKFAWESRVESLRETLKNTYTCQAILNASSLPLQLYTRVGQVPLACARLLQPCSTE
jgi:hypothetical protein